MTGDVIFLAGAASVRPGVPARIRMASKDRKVIPGVVRDSALETAAYAGKLAGIACQALLELVGGDEPRDRVTDDLDEAAAARYLAEEAWARGLAHISHSPFAAASETSPGRDSAAEEGVPAPRDVPPARGAGQLQLPTVEDLRDGAYLLRRLAQRNNMRGTTDGFRCFEIADQLSALADDVEAVQQAHK